MVLCFATSAVGAAQTVSGPLVVNERWPQCSDLAGWTRDVMRIEGVEKASETAQGKAFFRWLRLFSRMATGGMIQAYEGEEGKERYVTDAHKNLFVYGWGYCDTTSRIAEAAWCEYKRDREAAERVCVMHDNGGYHTMYRLRLDGRWGAFDPRYGYYLVDRDAADAAVLDWKDVGDDKRLLANKGYKFRSAPFFEFFGLEWERALLLHPAYFATEGDWVKAGKPAEHVFGNRMYQMGTRYHDMDFQLPQGAVIERFWDNSARQFYVPKGAHTKREEAFLPSGRFYRVTETMFDGNWPKHDPNYAWAKPYLETVPASEGYNAGVSGGRTIGQAWGRMRVPVARNADGVFDFYSPFVLTAGRLARGAGYEIRTLQAKASHTGEADVWSAWTRVGDVLPVQGVYRFQLRGGVGGTAVDLYFENGIMTLPRLLEGTNTVHCKLRDASRLAGVLRIRYRYRAGGEKRVHEQRLGKADFRGNTASYRIDAPGLTRCDSVEVAYLLPDSK
ncbi:MAG: hypothetical protein U0R19_35495 [Bryobacteraceae bacterium]